MENIEGTGLYGDRVIIDKLGNRFRRFIDDDGDEVMIPDEDDEEVESKKGGKGSGFFGHVGILGHLGGSAHDGSGISNVDLYNNST